MSSTMARTWLVLVLIFSLALVVALWFGVAMNLRKTTANQHLNHQNGELKKFSYAAKFVCGDMKLDGTLRPPKETPVKPGNYATAINVHNPHNLDVPILKKAVLALVEPNQGVPGQIRDFRLRPDGAFEIDCPDIINLLGGQANLPNFIKGFVVIYSPLELDVVGVYTAGSRAIVNSIDVEEIRPRHPVSP